jgi:hypothetical protein
MILKNAELKDGLRVMINPDTPLTAGATVVLVKPS